jgi:hypothetical protein
VRQKKPRQSNRGFTLTLIHIVEAESVLVNPSSLLELFCGGRSAARAIVVDGVARTALRRPCRTRGAPGLKFILAVAIAGMLLLNRSRSVWHAGAATD